MPATADFTFNLMEALADQLAAAFPVLVPAPLDAAHLEQVTAQPGVYQLFHNGQQVYVGKADTNLRNRLMKHQRKIAGRLNIDVADMTFSGLYLAGTWVPVGPERALIARYKNAGGIPWNGGGFGTNDPGVNRDSTSFPATHFDVLYPADLDVRLPSVTAGTHTVAELLPQIKGDLPYVFRYAAHHPDYPTSQATIPHGDPKAHEVFEALAGGLPDGWQVTALPGYVIMYKRLAVYPSARQVWQSSGPGNG